ncbi:kinase-like domain-containing protein [Chiua virens]|nr:kinase-like domain-containing protein [Chiua virens]
MISRSTSWSGTVSQMEKSSNAYYQTTAINVSKDVCSVAFLADGRHIVGGGYGGKVRVWEAGNGQEVVGTPMHAGSTVLNIAVSSDGKWVVAGTGSGQVIVWDAERHEKVNEFKAHQNWVRAVDVSPDVTKIASGSDDKTASVWTLPSGKRLLGPFEHNYFLAAVKFSPDGELFATATWWNESIRIYSSHDGRLLADVPMRVNSYENQSLAWSFTSTLLFALSFDGDIKCLDLSSGSIHAQRPIYTGSNSDIKCMIVARNGKFIVTSADSSVIFWDTTTHARVGPVVEHTETIHSIAISPNYALATGGGKMITIRSLRDILPKYYVDDISIPSQTRSGTWPPFGLEQLTRGIRDMSFVSGYEMIDRVGGFPSLGAFSASQHHSFHETSHSRDEYFSNDLTLHVTRVGHDPVASGGFADIYKGMLKTSLETVKVAIKAIRTYSAEDANFATKKRRLHREIKIWLSLKHANVLPLLGTTMGFGRFPAMVCPWLDHGSLTNYLEDHYDRLSIAEILTLLDDAASGLRCLHSCSVVHGDLSGSNVLVCANGRAYISDFGLSTLLTELGGSTFASSVQARGTLRWTAPELLDLQIFDDEPSKVTPTEESDVYSFGGVMLQILTGKMPYHYYSREAQVVHAVSRGMTPRRPSNALVTERRWKFIQCCWSTANVPQSRPSSEDLVKFTNGELLEMTRPQR